ncbi:MAG: sensor histidine kinase, partial [Chloroflexaceae bacterium]|nr:sensor histidine kinase [Chloroflexaceae bacterium]
SASAPRSTGGPFHHPAYHPGRGTGSGTICGGFEDDGAYAPRAEALQPDRPLLQNLALPWGYRSLSLLPAMLHPFNISLTCLQQHEKVQTVWSFPRPQVASPIFITPFRELERQAAHLAQQVAQVEAGAAQAAAPNAPPGTPVHEQVRQVLAPAIEELEQHLQALIQQAEWLATRVDPENVHVRRIRNLAIYNDLLVCNVSLALQGWPAPVQSLSINAQIALMLDLLQHKLAHLNITLELAPDVPPISIASIEIKQVLMNLLKNAAEATGTGGVLHIATAHQQERVIVRIQDTGHGIPAHVREKIFDLNFSTKGKGTNAGVGLYAVQSIVQRAGGQVAVASATLNDKGHLVTWQKGFSHSDRFEWSGPGTIFQITFPVAGGS